MSARQRAALASHSGWSVLIAHGSKPAKPATAAARSPLRIAASTSCGVAATPITSCPRPLWPRRLCSRTSACAGRPVTRSRTPSAYSITASGRTAPCEAAWARASRSRPAQPARSP